MFGQFASAACISKESLSIVHFIVSLPDVLLAPNFVALLVHWSKLFNCLQTLFMVWFLVSGWAFRILFFSLWFLPFAGPFLLGTFSKAAIVEVYISHLAWDTFPVLSFWEVVFCTQLRWLYFLEHYCIYQNVLGFGSIASSMKEMFVIGVVCIFTHFSFSYKVYRKSLQCLQLFVQRLAWQMLECWNLTLSQEIYNCCSHDCCSRDACLTKQKFVVV